MLLAIELARQNLGVIVTQKTAFVIMPIGQNGTEDARSYENLYSKFLEKTLKDEGYDVKRADKVPKGGSIFKDIITRLIESDLVVADLTSLNANVMIELGIRYAVKCNGTILICDRSKTPSLPFDLKDYRTIFYDDTMDGGLSLLRSVRDFAAESSSCSESDTDSPVFQHYKKIFGEMNGESLREENKALKESLSAISGDKSGEVLESELPPSAIIARAKSEIEDGNVPWILLSEAATAADSRDFNAFLSCIEKIISLRAITLSDREYIDLYYLARKLDLRNVLAAIIEIGLKVYPDSDSLLRTKMGYLAHSVHQRERQIARELISKKLKIDVHKGNIDADRLRFAGGELDLLSIYLDAVHRDGEDELALKLTQKLYENLPNDTAVVRNYARAVERMQGSDKAFALFLKSVQSCENVDPTSCRWLAAELQSIGKLRDAIEVTIFGCLLDLDEASTFGRLATYVSEALQPQNIMRLRELDPEKHGMSFNSLAEIIVYGHSCPNMSLEDKALFERAMRNADITTDDIDQYVDRLGVISRKERSGFVSNLYQSFSTDLTKPA